jgi:hypothetical protein
VAFRKHGLSTEPGLFSTVLILRDRHSGDRPSHSAHASPRRTTLNDECNYTETVFYRKAFFNHSSNEASIRVPVDREFFMPLLIGNKVSHSLSLSIRLWKHCYALCTLFGNGLVNLPFAKSASFIGSRMPIHLVSHRFVEHR